MTDQPEQFVRPFNLHLPDGTTQYGAEFPFGLVVSGSEELGLNWAALSITDLLDRMPPGTTVHRPEEAQL